MTMTRRSLRACWLAAAIAGAGGCGASPTAPPADPARAREALLAALDAWKAGATPADLARRTPAIHVADVEWSGGFRLVGYRAGGEGRLVGFDMNYPVILELKNPKGKPVTKTAVYAVSTGPTLLVLRQEG
jgi:hypothetical protein